MLLLLSRVVSRGSHIYILFGGRRLLLDHCLSLAGKESRSIPITTQRLMLNSGARYDFFGGRAMQSALLAFASAIWTCSSSTILCSIRGKPNYLQSFLSYAAVLPEIFAYSFAGQASSQRSVVFSSLSISKVKYSLNLLRQSLHPLLLLRALALEAV